MTAKNPENSLSVSTLIISRNRETLMQIAAEQGSDSKNYRILLAIHAADPEIPLLEAQQWLATQRRIPDDSIAAAELFFKKRPPETQLAEMVHDYRQATLDWLLQSPVPGFSDEEWQSVMADLRKMEALLIDRLQRFTQRKRR